MSLQCGHVIVAGIAAGAGRGSLSGTQNVGADGERMAPANGGWRRQPRGTM